MYKNKLLAFYRRSRRMPSYEEICTIMGFKSKNTAYYLVQKFVKEGFVKKDSKGKIIAGSLLSVPMLGTMHAGKTVGFPNPSEEETSDTMDLADLLQVDMFASKLFRVQGESMIDAAILPDDILLVECTDKWKVDDIVIAEIDGEETVKFLKKGADGKLFLRAANKDFPDMHPQEYLKVKAVVKSIIRTFK